MDSKSKLCSGCNCELLFGKIGTVPMGCGHSMHSSCIRKFNDMDVKQCIECSGRTVALPSIEETVYNGHDYVSEPKPTTVWLRNKEPFTFLTAKKPIKWIVCEKKWGLQRLLSAGVTIDDFVKNGYTWSDVKFFKDMQSRPREALYALGCNMEHFRDYAHSLPAAEIGIIGRDYSEWFGFQFADKKGPPTVKGGKNTVTWKCDELLALGITFDDLTYAGMTHVEQFVHIEANDSQETQLGVTDENFKRLIPPLGVPAAEPREQGEIAAIAPVPAAEEIPPPSIPFKPKTRRLHALKKK